MTLPAKKRPRSNRDRWATSEFTEWSTERGLLSIEQLLIDRYFSKDGETLDAGTGGGRIPLALRDKGFTSLTGFDYLPEMVLAARSSDPAGQIKFDTQDATSLDYPSDSFDQVIYVRLIASIDSDGGPAAALREAFRVLRSPGLALISFLWWEPRKSHRVVRLMGPWLRAQRALRRTDRGARDWPWLHVGERANYGALLDRGPYLHWFTSSEARSLLEATGFSIVLSRGQTEFEDLERGDDRDGIPLGGHHSSELYFVCTKA
jgi:SAM-dependent methyltransferase